MKYLRLTMNWLFFLSGVPIFFLVLLGAAIIDGLKAAYDNFLFSFAEFKIVFFKDTLKNRKPWLVDGTHWPFQKVKRKKKK